MQVKPNAPAMQVLRPCATMSGTSKSGFPRKLATIKGGCSSVGRAFKEMTNAPANVTRAWTFARTISRCGTGRTPRIIASRGLSASASHSSVAMIALTSSDVAENVSWSPIMVTCVQPGDCSGCIKYLTLMKIVAKSGSVTRPAAASASSW